MTYTFSRFARATSFHDPDERMATGLAQISVADTDEIAMLVSRTPRRRTLDWLHELAEGLDVKLIIMVVGTLYALGILDNLDRRGQYRPTPGGLSLGHAEGGTGTIGAVPRYDDFLMGLTNWHVALGSHGRLGDPTLQPGPLDGGTVKNSYFGVPVKSPPIRKDRPNRIDAALIEPYKPDYVMPYVRSIGAVRGSRDAELGETVHSSGRTTGLTHGNVVGVGAEVWIQYDEGPRLFEHQLLVASDGSAFSNPGDSGSLVIDSHRRACGLLFAGSDRITVMNPISFVEEEFGIRFDPDED